MICVMVDIASELEQAGIEFQTTGAGVAKEKQDPREIPLSNKLYLAAHRLLKDHQTLKAQASDVYSLTEVADTSIKVEAKLFHILRNLDMLEKQFDIVLKENPANAELRKWLDELRTLDTKKLEENSDLVSFLLGMGVSLNTSTDVPGTQKNSRFFSEAEGFLNLNDKQATEFALGKSSFKREQGQAKWEFVFNALPKLTQE